MTSKINSSFLNSCIKIPSISKNNNNSKNNCNSRRKQCSIRNNKSKYDDDDPYSCTSNNNINDNNNNNNQQCFSKRLHDQSTISLMNFYESIPDYKDINHLSEHEFYTKLKMLRLKQSEMKNVYTTSCKNDYGSLFKCTGEELTNNDIHHHSKNIIRNTNHKDDCLNYLSNNYEELSSAAEPLKPLKCTQKTTDINLFKKLPVKSVKINYLNDSADYCLAKKSAMTDIEDYENSLKVLKEDEIFVGKEKNQQKCNIRSKSVSPQRYSPPKLTVPKPFEMTKRDEEQSMLNELCYYNNLPCEKLDVTASDDHKKPFKANPVPITSRIPLYKQILADKEHRSQLAKLNSTMELQSQMKSFSFDGKTSVCKTTHRELSANEIAEIAAAGGDGSGTKRGLRRSLSYPQITVNQSYDYDEDDNANRQPESSAELTKKSLNSNKYSNYFYEKMCQDEYFKALNRKLRAEELLKISTLPFSSTSKKRTQNTNCESRKSGLLTSILTTSSSPPQQPQPTPSTRCDSKNKGRSKKRRIKKKIPNFFLSNPKNHFNFNNKKHFAGDNEFITTCPNPFEFETEMRSYKRKNKNNSTESNSSKNSTQDQQQQPQHSSITPIYPVARPNLAANLRTEWTRKKLTHSNINPSINLVCSRNRFRKIEWGIRKSPAWKSIYFDNTNDEDISIRLATRLAEQKARNEEHQINMEMMRQRVRATPLLLEGPTHWEPSRTEFKCSHKCDCDSRDNNNFVSTNIVADDQPPSQSYAIGNDCGSKISSNSKNSRKKHIKKSAGNHQTASTSSLLYGGTNNRRNNCNNSKLSNYSLKTSSTKSSITNNLDLDDLESVDKAFL